MVKREAVGSSGRDKSMSGLVPQHTLDLNDALGPDFTQRRESY